MKSSIFQNTTEKIWYISGLEGFIDYMYLWFVLIILKATLLRWVHNIPSLNSVQGRNLSNLFGGIWENWCINTFWLHLTFRWILYWLVRFDEIFWIGYDYLPTYNDIRFRFSRMRQLRLWSARQISRIFA